MSSLVAQTVKRLPTMWETWVQSLHREDRLEKEMVPTPVFLPGKCHGWGSLVGYSPWGRKESDMTERLHYGGLGLIPGWGRSPGERESEVAQSYPTLCDPMDCSLPGSTVYGIFQAMAPHSSILAWRIPWTEKPGGLQSMGSQRVGHDFTFTFSLLSILCCVGVPPSVYSFGC